MAQNSSYKEENLTSIEQFIADIRIYYVDDLTAKIYGQIKAGLINKFGPKQKTKRQITKITELGFDENYVWIAAITFESSTGFKY